jgi:hypothetical protein
LKYFREVSMTEMRAIEPTERTAGDKQKSTKKKDGRDWGELLLIFLFTVYFFFMGAEAATFPKKAMYFPMTVAIAGTLAGIGLLIPRIRLLLTPALLSTADRKPDRTGGQRATALAIIGLWVYFGASVLLGYIMATIIASLVCCFLLGRKIKTVNIVIYTGTLISLIYLIFEVLLQIKLPRPIWW